MQVFCARPGYDAFRAKDGNEVVLPEIIGIHQRAEDFHWGKRREGSDAFLRTLRSMSSRLRRTSLLHSPAVAVENQEIGPNEGHFHPQRTNEGSTTRLQDLFSILCRRRRQLSKNTFALLAGAIFLIVAVAHALRDFATLNFQSELTDARLSSGCTHAMLHSGKRTCPAA